MKRKSKPQILLISNVDSTFVRHDESLLEEVAIVKKLIVNQEKGIFSFLISQLRILFFLVGNISNSKITFCWFADYHSFLPALFCKWTGKPFYIIEGGYDTTYISEIDYGVHTSKGRSKIVDYAIKNATLNLPVSAFLAAELHARYGDDLAKEVLPTGYRVEEISFDEKEDLVLTVAAVDSQKRLMIKGVDRFIEIAKKAVDTQFVLVGVKEHLLEGLSIPKNLTTIDFLPKSELNQLYKKAKVYGQFSIREGLPNAVLEAMAYECVVVALDHSGISEAVGQSGYLLENWDVDEAVVSIDLAMKDLEKGLQAKSRVKEMFSEELRRERLHKLVEIANQ